MNIGIDIRPLQGHNKFRGIGRNISSLLQAISRLDKKNRYILYIFDNLENPIKNIKLDKDFNYSIKKVKFNYLSHKKYIGILFDEFYPVDASSDKLDVFLQTDMQYGLPRSVKNVAIFYDLIPFYFWNREKLKKYKGLRKIKITTADKIIRKRYLRVLSRYKKADSIIAISESSKKDLLNHFSSIKKSTVKSVPLGIDRHNLSKTAINKSIFYKKYGIKDGYLLYVGGVDLRKNIVGLANMYFSFRKNGSEGIKLVMAGKEFENREELNDLGWQKVVEKSKYKDDIVFTGYVSDDELMELYRNASAFVFPSKYEGFGLPVLEAMDLGAPVIAFNNSSIPEVAGDAAVLCKNEREFVSGIEKVVTDKHFKEEIIKRGYKQVNKFTWEKTAKETLDVLERTVKTQD